MSEMYKDDQTELRVVTIVDPIERIRSSLPDINLQPVQAIKKENTEQKSTKVVTKTLPTQNLQKTIANSPKPNNEFGDRPKVATNYSNRPQLRAVESNNSVPVNPNAQSIQRHCINNRRTPEVRQVSVVSTSLHDISLRRPKLSNPRPNVSFQPPANIERAVFTNPTTIINQRSRRGLPSRYRHPQFSERSPTSANNISPRLNRPATPAGFQPRGGIRVTTNIGQPRQVDISNVSIRRTINIPQYRHPSPNNRGAAHIERQIFSSERQVTPQKLPVSVNQPSRIVKTNRVVIGPSQPVSIMQKTPPVLPRPRMGLEKQPSQEALRTRPPIQSKVATEKPSSHEVTRTVMPRQIEVSIGKPPSQEASRVSAQAQTKVGEEMSSLQDAFRTRSPMQAKMGAERRSPHDVTRTGILKQTEVAIAKQSSQEISTGSPIQVNVGTEKSGECTSSPAQTRVRVENPICQESPIHAKADKEKASSQEALCTRTQAPLIPSSDMQTKTVKPKPIPTELDKSPILVPENSKIKSSSQEVSQSRLKPDVDMLQAELVKKQLPSLDVQIVKSKGPNPDSPQVRPIRTMMTPKTELNQTTPTTSRISNSHQPQSVNNRGGPSVEQNPTIGKIVLPADSKITDTRKDAANSLPSQKSVDQITRFGSNVTLFAVNPNTGRKPKSDPRSITPSVSVGRILLDNSSSQLESNNLNIGSNKRPKIKLSLLPKDKSPTTAAPPLETPPITSNQLAATSSLSLVTSSQSITSVPVCSTHESVIKNNSGNNLLEDDSVNNLSDNNISSTVIEPNTVFPVHQNKIKELEEFFVFKDTVPTFEDLENDMNQEEEPIVWTPEETVNESFVEEVTTVCNTQLTTTSPTITTDDDESRKQTITTVTESASSANTCIVSIPKHTVESSSVQTTVFTGPTVLNLTNNYSLQAMLRQNAVNSLSTAACASSDGKIDEIIRGTSPRLSSSADAANENSLTNDNTTRMEVDDDEQPVVINKINQIVLDDNNEDYVTEVTTTDEDYAECFSISSSDDGKDDIQEITILHPETESPLSPSISIKEPHISDDDDYYDDSEDFNYMLDTDENEEEDDESVTIHCRTIRIGSYKFVPPQDINISQFGLKLRVPDMYDTGRGATIFLKVPAHHIVKVLAHYGRTMPVIFFYLTPTIARFIRSKLRMHDPNGRYFNPVNGAQESHKRVTLVAESIPEDVQFTINLLYKNGDMLNFLSSREANDILSISNPNERFIKSKEIKPVIRQIQRRNAPKEVQTIMVFPPPPSKGGISINTEDYACLEEDIFLNDVIIDFYLQYLLQRRLSPQDKEKTHIFSSFFYKRLTNKSAPPLASEVAKYGNVDKQLLAAYIRHSRVKNWTKNINLFEKDYIVIPLNENQHWFLAIICFPNLSGPLRMVDNKPVDDKEQSKSTENSPLKKKVEMVSIDDVEDEQDKDEADGEDEEVDLESEESPPENEMGTSQSSPAPNTKKFRDPIKQPCILIFDSLAGVSRSRIIATLRDYLKIEYLAKHGVERDFSKNVMKGACPKVPQQNNFTDCGLFTLQYVEEFFKNKIWDYRIPMKILQDWFDPTIVSKKRYQIQQLLLELMREQNINPDSLDLPELNLSSCEDIYAESPEYDVTPVDSPPEGYDSDDFYSSPTNMHGSLQQYDDDDDEAYDPEESDGDEPYVPEESEDGSDFDEESYAELEAHHPFGGQDYNAGNEPYDPEDDTHEYFDPGDVEHDPLAWQEHDENESSPDEREDELEEDEMKSVEETSHRRDSKRALELPSVTVTSNSITTDLQGLKQYRMSGMPLSRHSDEPPPNKKYKK